MNRIFFLLFLLITQVINAQRNSLSGIIQYNNEPIEKAEIVNLTQKKYLITNKSGKYSLSVNIKDTIVFYAKNFAWQKLIINSDHLETNQLNINLELKTDELDEIIITKQRGRWSLKQVQEIIDGKYVDDFQTSPKNRLIYDGTIENGMDVNRMLGEVYKLFKKKKKTFEISFYKFATTTCDKTYFKEQLKMDSDEVPYFLEYCSKDPESKIVINKNNVFDLMDFLAVKNKEYIKINEE